jgi:hypothetical protein
VLLLNTSESPCDESVANLRRGHWRACCRPTPAVLRTTAGGISGNRHGDNSRAGLSFPAAHIFYLRTTLVVSEPDYPLGVEHDRIAVRIELARLWLLFLPTFAAVAFLVVTSAKGTTWKFSLLDRLWETSSYPIFLGIRAFFVLVVGLLSTWVSERWVMRDAEACCADTVSAMGGRFLYSFRDRLGAYYGGEAFPFALVRSPKLGRVVFYRGSNPRLSKIAMGCLFHSLVIIGRGLTDLDEATAAAHSVKVLPASQTL